MDTMTHRETDVIVGVDTHLRAHVAAVLDSNGGVIATGTFETTTGGYGRLLSWAESHGEVTAVGVEGAGAWGKALSRFLTGRNIRVIEVTRPNRQHRRRHGKSDVTDAVAAGRAVISGQATAVPRGDGPSEALRLLRNTRKSAVKRQTQVINQIRSIIVTCPDELRAHLDGLPTRRLVETCVRFRPRTDPSEPATAAKHGLRSLARQYQFLDDEIRHLTGQIATVVDEHAPPELVAMTGVGPVTAADLLITWGTNRGRITSEAAFAALCGVSAVEASSGEHVRHRLNRGGDRQANAALYRIVIVRLRYDAATRAYMQRRTTEGRTKKETIRCLKRYVARDIHAILQHAT